MEDRLKAKDNLIEKLDLKNHSLQTQRWKLSQRVAQKEQMSDMLNAVDFDQLKIENQQYLERIEEKNTELLQVKLTTGRTIQVCCMRLFTSNVTPCVSTVAVIPGNGMPYPPAVIMRTCPFSPAHEFGGW